MVDYKESYDFSAVKTVAILSHASPPANSALVSDMQMDRINRALSRALQEHGLEIIKDSSSADLLLSWHLVLEEMTDVHGYNNSANYNCWRCGPAVSDMSISNFTMGTLIVDLIDPRISQSVWRGVVKDRLKPVPVLDSIQFRYDAVADEMFENFPR